MKNPLVLLIVVINFITLLSGCATMIRGTEQTLEVISEPSNAFV